MTGREKCRTTREIKKSQAELYGIEMDFPECTYEGECTGICPTCKAEGEALFAAIQEKKKDLPEDFGKKPKPIPVAAPYVAGAFSYKPPVPSPNPGSTAVDANQQSPSGIFSGFMAQVTGTNTSTVKADANDDKKFSGYCTKCQTKTRRFCPNCGQMPDAVICQCGEITTNLNQKFCINCGNILK